MSTIATASGASAGSFAPLGRAMDAVKALLLATALLCALTGAAQSQSSTAARPSAAPSTTNGKVVFMRVGCYTCHGTVGQGGAGARLAPNTMPLAAMQAWVRGGTPGWSIARGMPAFPAAVISDSELADVQAYLASLPPPPKPDDIALLRP